MTSVLKKLYPNKEWFVSKGIPDGNGRCYHLPESNKSVFKPDFRNVEMKMIIEIDGAGGRFGDHFTSKEKCLKDIVKTKMYEELGYKVIRIPMHIQLDSTMIKYYFGIDYEEKLYPASDCHGFLHPDITLPVNFCEEGIERFKKEIRDIPRAVREKIIESLKCRIRKYAEKNNMSEEEAHKHIIPSSLNYMIDNNENE